MPGRPAEIHELKNEAATLSQHTGQFTEEERARRTALLEEKVLALEAEVRAREKTEIALRKREAELADFIENAVVPMHWVAADGTILWANRAELALLGYDREEYIGHPIAEFHVSRLEIEDILNRLSRHEELRGHAARLRCKDGSVRHVQIHSNVFTEDGKFVHTRCLTIDVTEMRGAHLQITAQHEELQRSQAQLQQLNARLIGELAAMQRLQQLSLRLVQVADLNQLLEEILDAAIEVTHADMGNVQLLQGGSLRIVAHRGFEAPFLEFFNLVHDSDTACGTALRKRERIVVENVAGSPIFMGTPAQQVMLSAGAQAVQSTPLISHSGRVLGMFSTHYRTPRAPGESELRVLDVLARLAADLIERKQSEDEVRHSERRFREIMEAWPIMVWIAGTDKLCYYFNKGWLEFVGRTLEQEQGNGWAENVHPDDFDRCLQIYVSCFDQRRPFEMEYRLRHHSGQYRWILDCGVPRYASDGTFEGYVGGCLDIHDQKEGAEKVSNAAAIVRRNMELLDVALSASGTGTFRWNPRTGEFHHFDEHLKKLFGLDPEQPVRNTADFISRVHPDDLPALLAAIEASRGGSDFEMEFRIVLPDQSIRWLYDRAQTEWEDGQPACLVGACIDVTGRKQAEEARQRLAAIVESSEDAIISKDLNGIVTSWNPQAERTFGYTAGEMIGRTIKTIIPPELHPDEEMILGKIRSGQKIDHFETVRLTKSGERIDVSLSISPVRDGQGKIVGAAKIARNITQNKQIERALRTTEKLAAAGRLAATVAHEINNPLEAITNLVYLAKRDRADQQKLVQYLDSARSELRRVSHIARQTLGFYRDTSTPVVFDIGQTLDDLLLLYEKRLVGRKIKVVRRYGKNLSICAFAGEIRQAISNFLSNAMDAMQDGGLLTAKVAKTHLWGNAAVPAIRISIADSGSGIPAEHMKDLFQPFFTTKAEVGTGLGLWITRNIVQRHGGVIQVKSRTGAGQSGTVFSICLPLDHNAGNNSGSEDTVAVACSIPA